MNHKNERVETPSSLNSQTIDLEVWAKEVRVQMIAALNKKNAQRETKQAS